jgi:hypothetical protein
MLANRRSKIFARYASRKGHKLGGGVRVHITNFFPLNANFSAVRKDGGRCVAKKLQRKLAARNKGR